MTSLKYAVTFKQCNRGAVLKIVYQSVLEISLTLLKGNLERLYTRIMKKE